MDCGWRLFPCAAELDALASPTKMAAAVTDIRPAETTPQGVRRVIQFRTLQEELGGAGAAHNRGVLPQEPGTASAVESAGSTAVNLPPDGEDTAPTAGTERC